MGKCVGCNCFLSPAAEPACQRWLYSFLFYIVLCGVVQCCTFRGSNSVNPSRVLAVTRDSSSRMMEGAESPAILVTADSSQLFLIILWCWWLYHYFCKENVQEKKFKKKLLLPENMIKINIDQSWYSGKILSATTFTKRIFHLYHCKVEKYLVFCQLKNLVYM